MNIDIDYEFYQYLIEDYQFEYPDYDRRPDVDYQEDSYLV